MTYGRGQWHLHAVARFIIRFKHRAVREIGEFGCAPKGDHIRVLSAPEDEMIKVLAKRSFNLGGFGPEQDSGPRVSSEDTHGRAGPVE
jgi:hypothetical protein